MDEFKQDASSSKLGDIYQYLVAILECIKLKDGYVIIENNGDASKFSMDDTIIEQYELKHHLNSLPLTNMSVDFWKTLYNWCKYYNENTKKFKKLILYTNSRISPTCSLIDWNDKDSEEKYDILEQIMLSDKKSNKGISEEFQKYYAVIFDSTEKDVLLRILEMFKIYDQQCTLEEICSELKNQGIFYLLSDGEKNLFTNLLIGEVVNIAIKDHNNWKLTTKNLYDLIRRTLISINVAPKTIKDLSKNYSLLEEERINLRDKTFVSEIKRIEFEKKIDGAILDYWKTNKTICEYCQNDPMIESDIIDYQSRLFDQLKINKEKCQLEGCGKDILQTSKMFYLDSMGINCYPATFNIASEYIKRGLIHEIVDDKKITWHLGDENGD